MNAVSAKSAVVTGAGSGIGKAVSVALAADGFDVALVGRRREPLEQVAAEITQLGRKALIAVADIGNAQSVRQVFHRVEAEFGRLDLLFNNAGTNTRLAPLEDLTPQEWQSVIDVNLTGAFLCTQQAFKLFKSQQPHGGRIINNGSISAHTPRPLSAPYTATKHAITGLTRSTALDGRPFDIACGQIDIGNAATEMTARMVDGVPQADGSRKPEPRIDADHVANAVAYMANLPLDANVLFMTVMATKMPFVGRG
jgi:NAD(P)-dependent dehydrogenase (short-subunit alcohol dehydrogenase family)